MGRETFLKILRTFASSSRSKCMEAHENNRFQRKAVHLPEDRYKTRSLAYDMPIHRKKVAQRTKVDGTNVQRERRKWPRLALAIPVFVRSRGENNKDLLEFATVLNVSAGGALVAVRRSLPLSSRVSLEIPSAPLVPTTRLPKASRMLRAQAVSITHADGYHLVGFQFAQPLPSPHSGKRSRQRKLASPV